MDPKERIFFSDGSSCRRINFLTGIVLRYLKRELSKLSKVARIGPGRLFVTWRIRKLTAVTNFVALVLTPEDLYGTADCPGPASRRPICPAARELLADERMSCDAEVVAIVVYPDGTVDASQLGIFRH